MKTRRTFALLIGAMSLALCLVLVGCGGGGEKPEEPAVDEPAAEEVEIEANVEPALINPGSLDQENTSDIWAASGAQAGETLYFTNAANDAGLTVTFVAPDGTETSVWDVEASDMHLTSAAGAEREFDIVFIDNFTCYDYATDTLYARGEMSQADYEALFADATFALDPDDPEANCFTLNADGTLVQTYGGNEYEGTWSVVNTTELNFAFDTYDDDYGFEITDGQVDQIMQGSTPFVRI
jgi:hypothetical protein